MTKRVLVAGADSYLGKNLVKQFKDNGDWVRALTLGFEDDATDPVEADEVIRLDLRRPQWKKLCEDIDLIASDISLTQSHGDLTYTAVDFQMNDNLLAAAEKLEVKRFLYVMLTETDAWKNPSEMILAQQRFAQRLETSPVPSYLVRSSLLFKSLERFYMQAKNKGHINVFGDGLARVNPISGIDLAEFCVSIVDQEPNRDWSVGGPDIYTYRQLAEQAFKVLQLPTKTREVSPKLIDQMIKMSVTMHKNYDAERMRFLLDVFTHDVIGKSIGKIKINEYFEYLNQHSTIKN